LIKYQDQKWYKEIIQVRKNDDLRGYKLFKGNKESRVKGWIAEEYLAGKFIDDKDGLIHFDAQDQDLNPIIPIDLDKNKVGMDLDKAIELGIRDIDYTKYDTITVLDENMIERTYIQPTPRSMAQAEIDRIKVTGKQPKAIANAKVRYELGRNTNVAEILTNTTSSISNRKNRELLIEHILNGDYGLLFSDTKKPGMVKIKEEDLLHVPIKLKNQIQYVHEGMYRAIVGGKKTRAFGINNDSKQIVKLIDRVWTDAMTRFKQSVVLKNPASLKTAVGFNVMMNSTLGVTPAEQVRWTREASNQISRNKKLIQNMAIAEAKGDTKAFQKAKNLLIDSELFRLELQGLATNVIDGLKGSSDLTSFLSSSIFQNKMLDSLVNQITMNQNTKTGNMTTQLFSWADTTGRYVAAKKFEKDGLSTHQAALKANALYSDMEQIAPIAIQLMDDYGVAPFIKWWTQTTPGIMKAVGNKPWLAIPIAVGTYALSQQMEASDPKNKMLSHNMSGINPIEQSFDYAESQFKGKWEDIYYSTRNNPNLGYYLAKKTILENYLPAMFNKPLDRIVLEYSKATKKKREMDMTKVAIRSLKSMIIPDRGADYRGEYGLKYLPDSRGGTQSLAEWMFPKTKVNHKGY